VLKLGITISEATVVKYMVRKRGTPWPTCRSLLRNQIEGVAAIDMFVVACASFQLLGHQQGPPARYPQSEGRYRGGPFDLD
jgi:hypothetical protein